MTDNVINAEDIFLGKRLLNELDQMIEGYTDRYHSFYTIYDIDGRDYLELCLKDLNDNSIIVVDMKPIEKYKDAKVSF